LNAVQQQQQEAARNRSHDDSIMDNAAASDRLCSDLLQIFPNWLKQVRLEAHYIETTDTTPCFFFIHVETDWNNNVGRANLDVCKKLSIEFENN
jgi:hypothetical protein